jgi:hypothetical protein
MKRVLLAGVVAGAMSVGFAANLARTVLAQAPACRRGMDQSPEESRRRGTAINLVRAIHSAQAATMSRTGRYGGFADLSGVPDLSTGIFDTRVIAAGKEYSILVRDTSDPCGYTLFSDQKGLIYIGAPLQ